MHILHGQNNDYITMIKLKQQQQKIKKGKFRRIILKNNFMKKKNNILQEQKIYLSLR